MSIKRINLRIYLSFFVVGFFLVYFFANLENFRPLTEINNLFLIIIALVNIMILFVNGLFTKFILLPFKKHISVAEAFFVSVISSIGNFFAPTGTGFGIRAVYLKKKHGLPYSDFLSTLSGNYILVFLVNSFAGLLALYLLKDRFNGQYLILALMFGTVFVVSIALSLIKINLPSKDFASAKKTNKAINIFYRVLSGWSMITTDKLLMSKLFGLVIINLVITMFMYWAIISSIGLTVSLPALLLFTVLGTFTIFINITPANLGVKETVFIFSSTILGFSISQILLIAIVDRGVQFTILFMLWIFSRQFKNKRVLTANS